MVCKNREFHDKEYKTKSCKEDCKEGRQIPYLLEFYNPKYGRETFKLCDYVNYQELLMPKFRRNAKFYQLEDIGQNLNPLIFLISTGDFLYVDNAESILQSTWGSYPTS
jgi:hypothetical protein